MASLQERISEQLDSMTPRDRNLATGLVVGLAILIVGGITMYLQGMLADVSSRVSSLDGNVVMVQAMRAELDDTKAMIQARRSAVEEQGKVQVTAFVEKVAQDTEVSEQLKSVKPGSAEIVGEFKQTEYTLSLKQMELEAALRFLYALETAEYPIAVRKAELKTQKVRGERMINLDLDVVTFSVVES